MPETRFLQEEGRFSVISPKNQRGFQLEEDLADPYLDTATEQILKEFKEKGERLKDGKDRLKEIHQNNHVHHLDWYLAAVDPPEDYVAALQIADVDKSLCVGADFKDWFARTCEEAGNAVFTPRFKGEKWSPVRFKKNNSQRANRAASKQFNMLRGRDCATVDLTFPREISEDYAREKKGRSREEWEEKAWDTFKDFYSMLREEKAEDGKHLGCHANLHIWKSEEPMKPHLHFHTIFNRVQAPYLTSEDREKAMQSREVQQPLERYRDENLSEKEQLAAKRKADRALADELGVETFSRHNRFQGEYFDADNIREKWKKAIIKNFPEYSYIFEDKEPSVYLQWYKENRDEAKIVHKYKYKTRQVAYDLFKYYSDSDVFPEQETPDHVTNREYNYQDFLSHALTYQNAARNFGVFKWGKVISEIDGVGISEVCPFCGGRTHPTTDEDFSDGNSAAWVLEMKDAFYGYDPPDGHPLADCAAR